MKRLTALLALLCVLSTQLLGQAPEEKEEKPSKPVPKPVSFETQHTGTFNGEAVSYTARAGELHLRDAEGDPTAAIFSFAYLKEGGEDSNRRPVSFVWNGGPGSASIWLHLGSLGPRRVVVPSDARDAGVAPYEMEDNPTALLDVTDLVFIDPVGTGFSRALGKHEDKEFWGLTSDASSIALFIQHWLTENQRWNSPKYLIGESFGTTRAAAVAGVLETGRPTVRLNGLILISQALDYTGSTPSQDNLIAYVTYLPTMAATAWYHKKVSKAPSSLEKFLSETREFAIQEYAPALFRGNTLDAKTRARIRERLAYFTGLSEEYIERANLRILGGRFLKELKREEGESVGRLDSRYVGDDLDDVADSPEGDAASAAIGGAYTALMNDYLARELNVSMERAYKTSGGRALSRNWRWQPTPEGQSWEPKYVNTAPDLSRALRKNPGLRVLIASGYYDFATPFFDAEYTFWRHEIQAERISMTYYEAGHMMYLHDPSRDQLAADMRNFILGQ